MRILQLTDFYRPVIGGLERHVEGLAEELAARGHRVAVATLAQQQQPAVEADGPVRVYRLPGWHRILRPFYQSAARAFHPPVPDPGVTRALWQVIARERPQIIHAHSWMLHSALPLLHPSRARLVITLHDYGESCPKKTMLRGAAVCPGPRTGTCLRCAVAHYGLLKGTALSAALHSGGRSLRRADAVVAVSRAVAAPLDTRRLRAPVHIIPTFVPDSIYEQDTLTRPSFLPREDGYMLFVGALARHKGLGVLLEAYSDLRTTLPLVLLGTAYGTERWQFPPGVLVRHDVPHVQVMAAMHGAGLAVVPSIWPDPCPQTLIEAMVAKKPIAATRVGGIQEVVTDGVSGVLVPPADRGALRDALAGLLADPGRCTRLGEAAWGYAQAYRRSRVTCRIEELYEQVLGDHVAPAEEPV